MLGPCSEKIESRFGGCFEPDVSGLGEEKVWTQLEDGSRQGQDPSNWTPLGRSPWSTLGKYCMSGNCMLGNNKKYACNIRACQFGP